MTTNETYHTATKIAKVLERALENDKKMNRMQLQQAVKYAIQQLKDMAEGQLPNEH